MKPTVRALSLAGVYLAALVFMVLAFGWSAAGSAACLSILACLAMAAALDVSSVRVSRRDWPPR